MVEGRQVQSDPDEASRSSSFTLPLHFLSIFSLLCITSCSGDQPRLQTKTNTNVCHFEMSIQKSVETWSLILDVTKRMETTCETHLDLISRIKLQLKYSFSSKETRPATRLLPCCASTLKSCDLEPAFAEVNWEVREVMEVREGFLLPVLQRKSCFVSVSEVSDMQQENRASVGKLQQTAEQCEWLCRQQRHWMFFVRR